MDVQDSGSPIAKLIAVDLDGTLVGPDNSISRENVRAIARAQSQGAAVVIVTGRPYVSADAIARKYDLPPLPLATFNGALIRRPAKGKILRSCGVPAAWAEEVVEECREKTLHLHYYLDDEMHVTQYNDWARLYCERNDMSCKETSDMRRFAGAEPFKLLVVDTPDTIKKLLPAYQQRWRDQLYVTTSMPEYLEFLSPQASKGQALDWLRAYYRVQQESTLAIGDALNDVPLLQRAGHSAAMPNADVQLKEIADFFPSRQASGVAEAIDWFLR